jgi:hypothetical protein
LEPKGKNQGRTLRVQQGHLRTQAQKPEGEEMGILMQVLFCLLPCRFLGELEG